MKIKSIFQQNHRRFIEDVIKVDDLDHISSEVEEYVITEEISKAMTSFFESYKISNSGANAVWISGFFGSGKSHLLKILSIVLENKELDGNVAKMFSEKIEDDHILKGDIELASEIPSESILFNIDQLAVYTPEENGNPILSIFYKVFYNHQGYFGDMPHIAEFEIWLDKEGVFGEFKDRFQNKTNDRWEEARRYYDFPKVNRNISEVVAEILEDDPNNYLNFLDKLDDNHKESIDDFCRRVYEYVSSKGDKFRLNFFVDEVGQFINNKTSLMLNLQTIAESLSTIVKGRSWILVTSQESIDVIAGDANKSQKYDFSKIQDRFKIRLSLASRDVDEVIEKRLLRKNEGSQVELKGIYSQIKDTLSTLFTFSDSGVILITKYKDENEFVNKFPFIPYQFDLFQQCIRALSRFNIFQGGHTSVGERSMLRVFQEVLKIVDESELNVLVSYDKMYEGIKKEFKSEDTHMISLAEKHIQNSMAIRVLKTLFLVKYFKEFKITITDISALLIDSYDVNLKEHNKIVKESLNLLEDQNYIERNGEIYEFLTDKEKDIQKEIKSMKIDTLDVNKFLKKIFFEQIIKENKILFNHNYYYRFHEKVNDTPFPLSSENELSVKIVTSNYPEYRQNLLSQTSGSTTMIIKIPEDDDFISDIDMCIKTDKYIKMMSPNFSDDIRERILYRKGKQNQERESILLTHARQLLSESQFYINGQSHKIGETSHGKSKVEKAFQILIENVYTGIKMLDGYKYSEEEIKKISFTRYPTKITDDNLYEPAQEILNLISNRKEKNDRTYLVDIKSHFESRPYGWPSVAIWCWVARLYKQNKIELVKDSNTLDDPQVVVNALISSINHKNISIEKIDGGVDSSQLEKVYRDIFDVSPPPIGPIDLAKDFKDKLISLHDEFNEYHSKNYSFLKLLEDCMHNLKIWVTKDYKFFIENVSEYGDKLCKYKENLLDPIRKFFNSEYKKIYDEIWSLFKDKNSPNISSIQGDEINKLNNLIYSEKPFFEDFREAKINLENVISKLDVQVQIERQSALNEVNTKIDQFKQKNGFSILEDSKKNEFCDRFNKVVYDIKSEDLILQIEAFVSKFKEKIYPNMLTELDKWTNGNDTGGYIPVTEIPINFKKQELSTVEDVNEYIESLRKEYLLRVTKNQKISL